MSTRLGGLARAIVTGFAWAVAWAPVAVLLGIGVIDPDNSMDEMWVVVGAYPGFLCGGLFVAAVALAGRGRRADELPLAAVALLGAVPGLLVGVVPFAIGEPTSAAPLWQLAGGFIAAVVALSAISAIATALAMRGVRRRRLQRA